MSPGGSGTGVAGGGRGADRALCPRSRGGGAERLGAGPEEGAAAARPAAAGPAGRRAAPQLVSGPGGRRAAYPPQHLPPASGSARRSPGVLFP